MSAHEEEKPALSLNLLTALKDEITNMDNLKLLKSFIVEHEKDIKAYQTTSEINKLGTCGIMSSIFIFTGYDDKKIGLFETKVTMKLRCSGARRRDGTPKCDEILMPEDAKYFRQMFANDNSIEIRIDTWKIRAPEWLDHTKWIEPFPVIKNHFARYACDSTNEWTFTGDHHDPEWSSYMSIRVFVYYRLFERHQLEPDVVYVVYDPDEEYQNYIRYEKTDEKERVFMCEKDGTDEHFMALDDNGVEYEFDYLNPNILHTLIFMQIIPLKREEKKQRTD